MDELMWNVKSLIDAKKKKFDDDAKEGRKKAVKLAKTYKKGYGNGVSTLIVIQNNSKYDLHYRSSKSLCGRWENEMEEKILKPYESTACLHVKKSGAACGSEGYLYLKNTNGDYFTLYWDSPWGATSAS